ncbi:MAG: DUF1566 domain-containing protein [Oligoflexia bacterium]|nr:DUF1566 domain-containing protein [Oligoflexia bacterium]
MSGANGSLSATIPEGYYSGAQSCTMSDSNLLATNIASGVTIFGVTGTAGVETHSACSAANQTGCISSATYPTQSAPATPAAAGDVLLGKEFYAGGALLTGTMVAGSNVTGADGSLTFAIPAGYYDGSKTATVVDTDLAATNVCTGKNILGTAGSAVCQSGTTGAPAGAGNILATYEAWDATGTKITGVMTNHGALDAQASFPGAGYYNGTVNNAPIASQIALGQTILGVSGSVDASFAAQTASQQHRDKTTTQVTQKAEATTAGGTVYTNSDPGYRAIPKISKDDEGYTGGSVTYVSRTNWDTACDSVTGQTGGSANSPCTCGLSGSLAARIADCASHGTIGTEATWDGTTKGNAGQGQWKLVTRTGAMSASKGREVWQDQRTGLTWSSLVSTALNWCKATGSNFIAGNPVAEDDPSNYCDNVTYQNTAGQAKSACFEDDGTYFTQTDAGIDSAGKGGLNRASTPVIGWRNPTKYDYQQADNNGIRFVMPDMGPASSGYEWSASLDSPNRSSAWLFNGYTGGVFYSTRDSTFAVRCVGR